MTTQTEALKLALEALEGYTSVVQSTYDPNSWSTGITDAGNPARKAIKAIKIALNEKTDSQKLKEHGFERRPTWKSLPPEEEALAQPEQEPVAVMELNTDGWDLVEDIDVEWLHTLPFGTKLYITPPQRKPLTDEDLRKLADKHLFYQPEGYEVSGVFVLARAIEAAHGIKE